MRPFWEDKVHVVIENLSCENITYKVQPENDLSGKMALCTGICYYHVIIY